MPSNNAQNVPAVMHKQADRDVPGLAALTALLVGNALAFGCWQTRAKGMSDHFLCSRWHLRHGKWHTLLTSCIFHQRPAHFVFNSFALWTVGLVAAEHLNNAEFLALCTVSGLGSTGSHVLLQKEPVMGASGVVMGLLTASSVLQPERQFSVMPFPMTFSLSQLAASAMLSNVLGLALRRFHPFHRVAWAAHVGGAVAGVGMGCATRTCRGSDASRGKLNGSAH
ncbi:unnamed protein product [Durusdinium trenchii]|uniref:Rhomboid-like protease 6 n=2 Tax=Durusdinium trenchii TaxID=1381693 RepID=A0ABP0ILG2_9DINO